MTIYFYNANREQMFTNFTNGILIDDTQLNGITIPYNAPNIGNLPPFYLDMTATGPGINPIRKNIETDVF